MSCCQVQEEFCFRLFTLQSLFFVVVVCFVFQRASLDIDLSVRRASVDSLLQIGHRLVGGEDTRSSGSFFQLFSFFFLTSNQHSQQLCRLLQPNLMKAFVFFGGVCFLLEAFVFFWRPTSFSFGGLQGRCCTASNTRGCKGPPPKENPSWCKDMRG